MSATDRLYKIRTRLYEFLKCDYTPNDE